MSLPPSLQSDFELVASLPAGKFLESYYVRDMRRHGVDAIIRILPNELASSDRVVGAFQDFFSNLNSVSNRKYIPSVHSVVGAVGNNVYVVEEYCSGISLTRFIEVSRKSSSMIADVTKVLWRVCEGLHHAHQKGVFHLCLAPQDILIDPDDYSRVKLTGFGSQILAETGHMNCLPNQFRTYIAPEVFASGVCSPVSDVYSLAVTVAEVLPEFLEASDVIVKSLSDDPGGRFSFIREFSTELNNLEVNPAKSSATPVHPVSATKSSGGLRPMVRIMTDPLGVTVMVNDRIIGVTTESGISVPWSADTGVSLGKSGYETHSMSFDSPPESPTIRILLTPALKLFTSPWKATVSINGLELGTTTHTGIPIPWDKGEIKITKQGFETARLMLDSAPSVDEICLELEPIIQNQGWSSNNLSDDELKSLENLKRLAEQGDERCRRILIGLHEFCEVADTESCEQAPGDELSASWDNDHQSQMDWGKENSSFINDLYTANSIPDSPLKQNTMPALSSDRESLQAESREDQNTGLAAWIFSFWCEALAFMVFFLLFIISGKFR